MYEGDLNQVIFMYESGTFGNTSGTGQWIGLVQSHKVTENINKEKIRYVGTATRNVDRYVDTLEDYNGNFTFFPQDWKMLFFAFGSGADSGSPSPYVHTFGEVNSNITNGFTSGVQNPFISFTVEDAQQFNPTGQNFIKTVKGCCVDDITISSSEGDKFVTCEVNYLAKSSTFTSGTVTAVTESTTPPYLWQDCRFLLPSGTQLNGMTAFSFKLMNNMTAKHYGTGSKTVEIIKPGGRDYEHSVTLENTPAIRKTLYEQYYKGGSEFNCMLHIGKNTGSQDLYIVMSGCEIDDMPGETNNEMDVISDEIVIVPKSVTGHVDDLTELYKAW